MAEFSLYAKTKSFISHILKKYTRNENHNFLDDLPKSIEDLWIDLYEYGFVEIEDVHSIKLWLEALSAVGYKFPGKFPSEKTAEISFQQKRFLSVGKDLNEIGKQYLTNKYQGKTYLESTCIHNKAGKYSYIPGYLFEYLTFYASSFYVQIPKAQKRHSSHQCFFVLLGSLLAKSCL
jgi:hypothetical protein